MPQILKPDIDSIASFIAANFYTPFTITRLVDKHLVTIAPSLTSFTNQEENKQAEEVEPDPDEIKEIIQKKIPKKDTAFKKVISFPYKNRIITIKFYHHLVSPKVTYHAVPNVLGLSALMLASMKIPFLYFPLILAMSRSKSILSSLSDGPSPEETHLSSIEAQANLTKRLKQAENLINKLKQQSIKQKAVIDPIETTKN